MDRIMSTSIILLGQNVNANYVGIMVFEPCFLFFPCGSLGGIRHMVRFCYTSFELESMQLKKIILQKLFLSTFYHIDPSSSKGTSQCFDLVFRNVRNQKQKRIFFSFSNHNKVFICLAIIRQEKEITFALLLVCVFYLTSTLVVATILIASFAENFATPREILFREMLIQIAVSFFFFFVFIHFPEILIPSQLHTFSEYFATVAGSKIQDHHNWGITWYYWASFK